MNSIYLGQLNPHNQTYQATNEIIYVNYTLGDMSSANQPYS